MKYLFLCLCAGLALTAIADIPAGNCQEHVSVTLSFDSDTAPFRTLNSSGQPIYAEADPIAMRLELMNISGHDVYVTYGENGFSALPFHLYLRFTGPDGRIIFSDERIPTMEPGPPPKYVDAEGNFVQADRVEVLPAVWSVATPMPNIKDQYALNRVGRYSVRGIVPFREYPGYDSVDDSTVPTTYYAAQENVIPRTSYQLESNSLYFAIAGDSDCDGYFYPDECEECPKPAHCDPSWVAHAEPDCNDNDDTVHPDAAEIPNGIDDDCNPATPDLLGTAGKGKVVVTAELHEVGMGNYPGSTKKPLPHFRARLLDRSPGSCVAGYGLSWKNYPLIWKYCKDGALDDFTDAMGKVTFIVDPGDYAVFALYPTEAGDVYMGGIVDTVLADQTVSRYLQTIQKADGKKVPAKNMKLAGSELLIIEPEYIEWTGSQELYPFVFESLGDWGVTTSITPPEGFVADQPSLSTDVNSDLRALQFNVTDVGSDWVDTEVEYLVKHSKKIEKIKSKIGVIKNKDKDKEE